MICWKRWIPLLSWITGWINVSGWTALVASAGLLGSPLIIGCISLYQPAYTPQRWHQFLIYIAYNLVAFLLNAFANKIIPHLTKGAFTWSIAGFVVISITILATASPNYPTGDFVFRKFMSQTNWPDGIAWLLGLLQGGFGLTGYDAVAHMVEEIPHAAIEGPKIMIACVAIGTFTGFVFLTCLLFVAGNVDDVTTSAWGPLLQILFNATNSRGGSICLLIFPLVCLLFAALSITTTSSRMTWAFARDDGLPASKVFARVHPTLGVPLNALLLTTVCVIIFGCIFLGSSSALNAIISPSVVLLGISYALPPAVNCLRGRKMLPSRHFILPGPLGWFANLLGIAYVIVTTVLFVFPPALPVTGSNMNYCIVAFAVVLVISVVQWFVDGRRNFKGPQIELVGEGGGLEKFDEFVDHEGGQKGADGGNGGGSGE